MLFSLDELCSLAIESEEGKKLRLVVLREGEEWVCRQTNSKTLRNFLATPHSALFKGRLQLHKIQEYLAVVVKERVLGHVLVVDFEAVLGKLQ